MGLIPVGASGPRVNLPQSLYSSSHIADYVILPYTYPAGGAEWVPV